MTRRDQARLGLAVALAATVAITAAAPPVAEGAGGTYEVVKCSPQNRPHGGTHEATNAYVARSECSEPEDFAFKFENVSRALEGRRARIWWTVPEPLSIVGVAAEARLRSADGHKAHLYMASADGRMTHPVAAGDNSPTGFKTYEWEGKPQQQFVAELVCTKRPSCDASELAKMWIRNLRFRVLDSADPTLEVGEELFEGGWLRGELPASIFGTDAGAGVFAAVIQVNEVEALAAEASCGGGLSAGLAAEFSPCAPTVARFDSLSTSTDPFVNGANLIRACTHDFGGNATCRELTALVDNEVPRAAFMSQDPQDPELIRVAVDEQFSGLASGVISFRPVGGAEWQALPTQTSSEHLRARVDSASHPPGAYEFRASFADVAGNEAETTQDVDGLPKVLEFPLKSGVHLQAHIQPGGSKRITLPFGRTAAAKGRLLDASGAPMPGQEVVVDEDFGEGALIDHRVRTVITDEDGRWYSRLPAGPSRAVSVTYAGDQRYLGSEAAAGRLAVRTGAKLDVSRKHVREGRAAVFRGRIERLGARIPPRGKTLQLQYQDPTSGRWFTVRNPFRSKSDGRFAFRYGFGTHYEVDVAIRFRLKVPPEVGWPYRATTTRPERVIVEARP
jgi:hypothetical protein